MKWCNFTADETLDDSSQLSWGTPEFASCNIAAVNAGMSIAANLVISLKFIPNTPGNLSTLNEWQLAAR